MPWKASSVMDERLRFVARLLDGEQMSVVCREFGISRKTGYKIFDRYKEHGLEALTDRSRRPVRYANQLQAQVENLIVSLKRDKPHWGARKLRELLVRRLRGDVRIPAKSTIHAVLDRHGLVRRRGRKRPHATGTPLSQGLAPNDLWCADYKGEFQLGNRSWCYPLTVTDHASRFVLLCEALEATREDLAFAAFERLFAERGLPLAIRSDNGVPFASANALFNLSKSRSGGCVSALASSASNLAGRSRTDATSACTSRLRRRPRDPQVIIAFNSSNASMTSCGSSMTSDLTRGSPCAVRLTSTPRHLGFIAACPSSPIRSTTATSSSLLADASACIARRSTSLPCWQVKRSE